MEEKKNLRQVRKIINAYFGKDVKVDITAYRYGKEGSVEVVYDKFLIEEDVREDLARLIGRGWRVSVSCGLGIPMYISALAAQIEACRLSLIGKLKDRPHFREWHVNRYCTLDLLHKQQFFTDMLRQMQYLDEHPEKVQIWDMFPEKNSNFASCL